MFTTAIEENKINTFPKKCNFALNQICCFIHKRIYLLDLSFTIYLSAENKEYL